VTVLSIAFRERLDGVVVLQTFLPNEILMGQAITVANVGDGMDGNFTVVSTESYEFIGLGPEGDFEFDWNVFRENQVIYFDAGDDVQRDTAPNTSTITYTSVCTWIVNNDVLSYLGVSPATANDTAFVTVCTDAANALAFRRRRAAGYFSDVLATAPSADVKLGTTMMAAQLYRSRGSAGGDSFQSYESLASGNNPVAMGDILRLWGCNRAQVA
jgi:hypothetical protein